MKLKPLMIQGTMSNSGKTFVVAGLCRILKKDGYRCAPFKSQNMALNSYVTEDGWEIGRAQAMQAEAAMTKPLVEMNPILLKPNSDMGSQVIVSGEVLGNVPAAEYYKMKQTLKPEIEKAFHRLAGQFDAIVLEGAGSPAEINLKENDIVNMGMAKMAGADVLLVADIDRGGVFASVYGTVQLLEPEEKARIKGIIINKFRGDVSILEPGLRMIEEMTGIPVVGVIPYADIRLDDEDSLSEHLMKKEMGSGIDVAVIRLPHISNFTDFTSLELEEPVSLRYVTKKEELGSPDLILLPGTKNTMYDLKWLRESGLEAAICRQKKRCRIAGICGGYQMMGEILEDPHQLEHGGSMRGMDLLPLRTVFEEQKQRGQKQAVLCGDIQIPVSGYEIHMGKTTALQDGLKAFLRLEDGSEDGFCSEDGRIWGSYFHGIFDNDRFRRYFLSPIMEEKGLSEDKKTISFEEYKEEQYDRLEQLLRESLDMEFIYRLLKDGGDAGEKKEKGCIHLYYGDGKGKTTAAVGLAVRAAGAGRSVCFYQFLKDNSSSERKVLSATPGITCLKGPEKVMFTSRMTEEEKVRNREENDRKLQEIMDLSAGYDMLILDEALYAVRAGQLSEELLLRCMRNKEEGQELILTGRDPSPAVMACADYCSCIRKEKHPFDRGVRARHGIEY